MSLIEILAGIALVAVSAYISASELALFSLSRFQLRSLREQFRSGHRKIKKLLGDPGGLLVTILVVNEVVNVTLSALIATSVSRMAKPPWLSSFPAWAVNTFLSLLITAPIILIFCEITPKVIGAKANRLVAAMTVGGLDLIYDLFKPVRAALKTALLLASRARAQESNNVLKESEFLMMLEEGHKEGAIEESELGLIQNVFDLDNTTVASILTPMSQAQTILANATLRDALIAMRSQRYKRIPVTTPNRKKIVGILYSKDLLRAKLDPSLMPTPVSEIMRKPLSVPPSMRLSSIFRKFKQQHTHMAVVQSTAGDPIGIVTMTDVLDALFDDILPDEPRGERA